MTQVVEIKKVIRKWTDLSSKVKAAAAGGFTTGGVTSVLAAINPDWHPAAWLIGLITIAGAVISAYVKGETIRVTSTDSAGNTLSDVALDLSTVPTAPWITELAAAQEPIAEVDATPAAADYEGKHEA